MRESPTEVGHAVRALYLESGVVDVAVETGDAELLASSIARWDDMVATKTALTGGNGSRHSGEAFGDAFELPPDRAYNETCAAIASFQWSWRLLLATGESKYADLMERVLYNGFGAAVSADGQRFFYVNPLQRRDDHFEDDDPGRRASGSPAPAARRTSCAWSPRSGTTSPRWRATCCTCISSPARGSCAAGGGHSALTSSTDYPWSGAVGIHGCPGPGRGVRPGGAHAGLEQWTRPCGVNGEPAR